MYVQYRWICGMCIYGDSLIIQGGRDNDDNILLDIYIINIKLLLQNKVNNWIKIDNKECGLNTFGYTASCVFDGIPPKLVQYIYYIIVYYSIY